jgi:hypothetical protein
MIRRIFFVFRQDLEDTEVFSIGPRGDCFRTNLIAQSRRVNKP